MSTNKKRLIVVSVLILVFIGGMFVKMTIEEKERKEAIITREGPRIEKYFKYNFKNIEKVTIETVDKAPMGGYFMEGYINDSKDVGFSAIIDDKFEGNMMYSPEIVPRKKDSDGVRILKKIEDIEKEEKNKE